MPYLNTTTGEYPVTEQDIRHSHPNVSFAHPFVPPEEYVNVFPVPRPAYNSMTHEVVEAEPVQTEKGHYEQSWSVVALSAQEQGKRAQEAASELISGIVAAVQQRLDAFAMTRNYDGILSACTYATSEVQKFRAEGQYCVNVRDQTWAKLYQMLGEVQAGTRAVPTGFADVVQELPALEWPEA